MSRAMYWVRLAAFLGISLGVAQHASAASIRVINADGPNEGFNDPTAWSPRGGNSATTLGAARLAAFQRAASIWGERLSSPVEITVQAQMDPVEPCQALSAVLGAAGPSTVHENFPGAPLSDTWYPQALANALSGLDLSPNDADIVATFNTSVDNAACLGSTDWYYGLDGNAGSNVDFVSVVLHELGHGLGFIDFADLQTGARLSGHDDAFSHSIQDAAATPARYFEMSDAERAQANVSDPNLIFVGTATDAAASVLTQGAVSGHARLHAPNPVQVGSSVAHFSPALFPNQAMEPNYAGPNHDPGLALQVLRDIGWQTNAAPVAVLGAGGRGLLALLLSVTAARCAGRASRPDRSSRTPPGRS